MTAESPNNLMRLKSSIARQQLAKLTIVSIGVEFGLVIEFMDHLQIATTSNYGTLANSCTRILTTAQIKYFFSPAVAR
jgi:hypothetical protein